MIGRVLAGVASALALAACGGEDSGGAAPLPPTGGGTPTPSPSPSPSPTPSPTPTPTYSTIAQLTGSQQFDTTCVYTFYNPKLSPNFGVSQEFPFGDRGKIRFDPAAGAWAYVEAQRFNSSQSDVFSFGPTNLVANPPANTKIYRRTEAQRTFELSLFAAQQSTFKAEYLQTFNFATIEPDTERYDRTCAYGVPTVAGDMLPATSTTYTALSVVGTATLMNVTGRAEVYSLGDSTGTFTVDAQARTVSMSVQLAGRELLPNGQQASTITKLPLIASTVGTITDARTPAVKTFTGSLSTDGVQLLPKDFSGAFFGPQGREVAFSFRTSPSLPNFGGTLQIVGVVVAQR